MRDRELDAAALLRLLEIQQAKLMKAHRGYRSHGRSRKSQMHRLQAVMRELRKANRHHGYWSGEGIWVWKNPPTVIPQSVKSRLMV